MLFDQVVLQEQRINFRCGHRDLNIGDAINQRHGLCRQSGSPEVAADPILKIFSLSHIEQLPIICIHLVDPGTGGKGLQELLVVKICHRLTYATIKTKCARRAADRTCGLKKIQSQDIGLYGELYPKLLMNTFLHLRGKS